jgi:hypothetical protein
MKAFFVSIAILTAQVALATSDCTNYCQTWGAKNLVLVNNYKAYECSGDDSSNFAPTSLQAGVDACIAACNKDGKDGMVKLLAYKKDYVNKICLPCFNYGKSAVKDYQLMVSKCNPKLEGPAWSADESKHRESCIVFWKGNTTNINSEHKGRQTAIAACPAPSACKAPGIYPGNITIKCCNGKTPVPYNGTQQVCSSL